MADLREVVSIVRTCSACPSQWEGELKDGRKFYMRFRWGSYGYGVGADIDEAVGNCDYVTEISGQFDGFLSDDAMIAEAEKHGFEFGPGCWKHEKMSVLW